jgi:hypothetical protein
MDDCRFDNWTRTLAAVTSRRLALKDLTAAGVALVALAGADLGLATAQDVLIEGCRLSGDGCARNKQCCSNKCHRRKRRKRDRRDGNNNRNRNRRRDRDRGVCRCLGDGKSCNKDAACCKGRCDPFDGRCRCVDANQACNVDSDCCGGRICRADDQGNKFCKKN